MPANKFPPSQPFGKAAIAAAMKLWRDGRLVAFGTETVYGLGGDATNAEAVAAIFRTKHRPATNPLISHVADIDAAFAHAQATPLARRLAEAFWPGPMTLVLQRLSASPIVSQATANLPSIAIRVPGSATARELLAAYGKPVVAPSANMSGGLSPTMAGHVATAFAGQREPGLIIDSGACVYGLESTVIDGRGDGGMPTILRQGSLTGTQIAAALGLAAMPGVGSNEDNLVVSPGQQLQHYAPKAKLRLNAAAPKPNEAWLGFAADPTGFDSSRHPQPCRNLSRKGDLNEAAANLFAMLHALDGAGVGRIAVAPIPDKDLGAAINDRLTRATTPKA